ncbi:SMI1/KNR4 family protein [Bradyrhizobium algeriense]|uniref:SMI1/KNR4 family protein n=1 Tax=Bradyrhizobium algeriense TaxID=634784 RepID=UPI000D3795A7|nr:SMI1/KNR4 family protein [Bradyrhizobium algeriense]
MGPSVQKLLEIAGTPFVRDIECSIESLDHLGEIGTSIRDVLARKNGFFCFESALRFFPSVTVETSWGLAEWNSSDLWKADYRGLANNIFCFAEDVFGQQFAVCEGKIGTFEVETGDFRTVALSLEEWASMMLLDYNQMTGFSLAHEWQVRYGPLRPRHRLMAKTPFVLGGEYSLENFAALDSLQLMKTLGNLAHQIHALPDGSKVKFKVI